MELRLTTTGFWMATATHSCPVHRQLRTQNESSPLDICGLPALLPMACLIKSNNIQKDKCPEKDAYPHPFSQTSPNNTVDRKTIPTMTDVSVSLNLAPICLNMTGPAYELCCEPSPNLHGLFSGQKFATVMMISCCADSHG